MAPAGDSDASQRAWDLPRAGGWILPNRVGGVRTTGTRLSLPWPAVGMVGGESALSASAPSSAAVGSATGHGTGARATGA